jgi:ATP-binding protein involved in chromosome partitioning
MKALGELIDPSNSKTLAENDGVRKVEFDSETNKVNLVIGLADDKTPKLDDFQFEIMKKMKVELGIGGVKVEYVKLSTRSSQETNILGNDSKVKFLAIASGKGGVGKSTITANLAIALTRLGKKVGLIDADIYGSSINQVMEIDELPTQKGSLISPVVQEGIEVITTAMLVQGNKPLMWRGPMLQKLLKHFLNDVDWSEKLEYILIDLPPGTGDVAIDIQQLIPQTRQILVTTPHPSASHVAVRAGIMAKELNHPILGVIENMSYIDIEGTKHRVFGKGGGAQVAFELQTDLIATLPLTQPENGKYHSLFLENDSLSKDYDNIAKEVIRLF